MDQIKIGKFIAENRHALGLTQAQLAEKLTVSDKSVSKWERGVCLPDASLYFPLCETLGITVNELFAGERLPEPEAALKSSEQIIVTVAADSGRTEKRLRRLRIVFWILLILLTAVIGLGLRFPQAFLKILSAVYGLLLCILFFAACYFLIWLFNGRGRKGRVEDRAASDFLEKMAFLRGNQFNGPNGSINRFR